MNLVHDMTSSHSSIAKYGKCTHYDSPSDAVAPMVGRFDSTVISVPMTQLAKDNTGSVIRTLLTMIIACNQNLFGSNKRLECAHCSEGLSGLQLWNSCDVDSTSAGLVRVPTFL